MGKILVVLLCISAGFLGACNKSGSGSSSGTVVYEDQVTAAGVTMQWNSEGSDLAVTLTAQTAGWVAVGFSPTVGMQDANIIIGYVSGGTPSVRDDYGVGVNAHSPDTTGHVTVITGTETGGVTQIKFRIPLDSGDAQDRPLAIGSVYKTLLAYGSADNFTLQHANRALVNIRIK